MTGARRLGFKLTPSQRHRDRKRAAAALGRPLRAPECLHHHSPTQLVICQDVSYHALLHQNAYVRRLLSDNAFAQQERGYAMCRSYPSEWPYWHLVGGMPR